jgi:glycosyltransferase involved in cell wall biosynthesis
MKCIWIVNQFAGTPESGWGERHFFLSKPALEAGYRVVIISSGNNHMFSRSASMTNLFTHQVYEGVEYCWVRIPKYNPQNFTRFIAMLFFAFSMLLLPLCAKKIGRPDYLLLSSMSMFPFPALVFLKRYFKAKKLVFEVRDLWPLTPIHLMGYSRKNPMILFLTKLEQYCFRKSDAIVSLFDESRDYINNISGVPAKFNWIPNGISSNFLNQAGLNSKGLNINIPNDKLVVCYTGTLGYANALDPFFELIANQKDLADQVFFLIVGDGYNKTEYEKKVAGVENVLFTGKLRKADIPIVLEMSDICFISWHKSPLYQYGVSANKYFDYLASGKPILAAQEGINDPVKKSGAGIIIKNEGTDIAKGLHQFIAMGKAERDKLGEMGRKYVMNHHTYDALGRQLLEVLTKK